MMFRRNNQRDTLPSTSYGGGGGGGLPFGGGGGGAGALDGSGRSIKMDAPVVKAWKKASGYTRWTYYLLGFTFFMVFYGFRSLRYWNASIWLTCHQQECTLEVTPPGTRTITVVFPRTQLSGAQAIKTDKEGNFIEFDRDKYDPPTNKGQKKKKYKSNYNSKGPDAEGRYKTYRVNLLKESPKRDDRDKVVDGDFSKVKDYLNEDEGMYSLHFRHFTLSQSRMRIRSNINKVDSYIRKRRQKLLIKESATLPWQGILCLVFGLVGLLLTILVGQFWDEAPLGGPGARRSRHKKSSYRGNAGSRRNASGYQYQKNY